MGVEDQGLQLTQENVGSVLATLSPIQKEAVRFIMAQQADRANKLIEAAAKHAQAVRAQMAEEAGVPQPSPEQIQAFAQRQHTLDPHRPEYREPPPQDRAVLQEVVSTLGDISRRLARLESQEHNAAHVSPSSLPPLSGWQGGAGLGGGAFPPPSYDPRAGYVGGQPWWRR